MPHSTDDEPEDAVHLHDTVREGTFRETSAAGGYPMAQQVVNMGSTLVQLLLGGAFVTALGFAFSLGILWNRVNVNTDKLAQYEIKGTPYVAAQMAVLNEKLEALRQGQQDLKESQEKLVNKLEEHMKK